MKGHLIVATPLPTFERDHAKLARDLNFKFNDCFENSLVPIIGPTCYDLRIIGIGHSLGGKLTALIDSSNKYNTKYKKICNVFLAFNNYGALDSLDMIQAQSEKFTPEVKSIIDGIISAPEVANFIKMAKTV